MSNFWPTSIRLPCRLLAVRSPATLTPVYIHVDQPVLHKTLPWYRSPPRRPHFTIRVGADIDLEPYRHEPPPKASRRLNAWLVAHYEQEPASPDGYNASRND